MFLSWLILDKSNVELSEHELVLVVDTILVSKSRKIITNPNTSQKLKMCENDMEQTYLNTAFILLILWVVHYYNS